MIVTIGSRLVVGFNPDVVSGCDSAEKAAKTASKYAFHGRNWATRFTYGWMTDLGIYRLTGKVRYYRATSA
ncbi:MAG: hypothetical protein ACRDY0_06395 [Acidimicrobiales bacterium]